MKKIVLVSVLCVALFALFGSSLVSAAPRPQGSGGGWFVMTHDGDVCRHYFGFSVNGGIASNDGWNYSPNGHFDVVCRNSTSICMHVKSDELSRFRVTPVAGGLSVVFEGTASVNMGSGWQDGWQFTVQAVDYGEPGRGMDTISIQLTSPEGMLHNCEGVLKGCNISVK